VERIQLAHAAQVADLRTRNDSLHADNNNLIAQQHELFVHHLHLLFVIYAKNILLPFTVVCLQCFDAVG